MTPSSLFDVRGNIAFVTGAASGLGFAFAHVLAENGAHVVMADIDAATLAEKEAQLVAEGGSVEAVTVDVADPAAVHAAIAAAAKRHGRLDTVFANAGISGGPGIFSDAGRLVNVDPAALEHVLRVNVGGTFATLQAAAAAMTPQGHGRIIVTTSAAALRSTPMLSYAYSMSKAALIHLVRHAARELAPHGISVNGIAPGPFGTNLGGGAMLRNPAIAPLLAADVPLGRIGEPNELKGIALYLASDASSYTTGSIVAVDGGASA